MNVAEIKSNIIDKINAINDINLLLKIDMLLKDAKYPESDEKLFLVNEPALKYESLKKEDIYVFNEWQQERINIALEQYKNGECISDEEAQIEIEKWFEEQEK
jgi:hypothetical protein